MENLHSLVEDEDYFVRWGAAGALGAAFQDVADKKAAWKDLQIWLEIGIFGCAVVQLAL